MSSPKHSSPLLADEAAVQSWLRRRGHAPDAVTKIVLLGNSGVGKSWLCNAFLSSDVFEHASVADSVTADLSFACFESAGGCPFVVCNVPGLVEADPDNIGRNKAAVERLFADLFPEAPTVLLFVSLCANGRLRAEDVQALVAVQQYLGDRLTPDAFAFVTNAIEYDRLDESDDAHHRSIVATVRKALPDGAPPPGHWAFVPKIAKKHRVDYASAPARAVHERVAVLIADMSPRAMNPPQHERIAIELLRFHAEVTKQLTALLKIRTEFERLEREHEALAAAAFERRLREATEEAQRAQQAAERKQRELREQAGGGCSVQ